MELILKISFWAMVVCWILAIGAYTDPTVRRERKKRKQERLAMDFHDRIKGGHPEE
jgi:hypothetical protein